MQMFVKHKPILLYLYCNDRHCFQFAVFLIIILITQIAIGIVAFVKRDGWDKILDENLSQTFDKYGTDAATNESINALQHTVGHSYTWKKWWPVLMPARKGSECCKFQSTRNQCMLKCHVILCEPIDILRRLRDVYTFQ